MSPLPANGGNDYEQTGRDVISGNGSGFLLSRWMFCFPALFCARSLNHLIKKMNTPTGLFAFYTVLIVGRC